MAIIANTFFIRVSSNFLHLVKMSGAAQYSVPLPFPLPFTAVYLLFFFWWQNKALTKLPSTSFLARGVTNFVLPKLG
jgi:hypothetical protein